MSLLIASSLLIPLSFGGLSTKSPVYQRAIAIGQFAGQLAGQQAQAQENGCISGVPLRSDKAREAMLASNAAIQNYWDQAKASGPFSATGAALLPLPVSFTAAGDGDSAAGHWEVRGANGQLAGTFVAQLREKGDVWSIEKIDPISADQFIEPLIRYCHTPGDILASRVNGAKAFLEARQKDVVEREQKVQTAIGTPKEDGARKKAQEARVEAGVARANLDRAMAETARVSAYRAAQRAAFEASRR